MENLPKEQVEELKSAFALFDKDGNGNIDRDELRDVLVSLGTEPTEEDIDDMFSEVDGAIDFEEFAVLMCSKLGDADKEEEMRETFALFDRDGNGKIDAEELKTTLKKLVGEDLSEEEIQEMMKAADTDGDGEIDFEEFKTMMDAK